MRKTIMAALAAAALVVLSALPAWAQSTCSQYLYQGKVLTPAQWQYCFGIKQDVLNYVPVNKAGDTMLGKLTTFPSATGSSGFNIAPGQDPSAPKDGDVWITLTGIYVRINGVTIGPLVGGAASFAATSPLSLSFPAGVATYACPLCVTSSGGGAITGTAPITVSGAGVVALTTPLALNFGGTGANLTASNGGIFYSTGSAGAILAGTATARQMLQSGASTTPAWSTTTWPATSTINRILYSSSANVIGEITTANGGLLNTSSSGVPSITATPILGVAGTTVGTLGLQNATSGTITISPPTGALGTVTLTLPALTDNLMSRTSTDTMTNKTFNSAGTGNVLQVSGITVSAGQYPGTTTNDDATSGNAGEYGEISLVVGSATTITSTTPVDISTLSQTFGQGDWDIWAAPSFSGTSTAVSGIRASLSLTSNTEDTAPGNFVALSFPATGTFATYSASLGAIHRRLKVANAGSTTVRLVGNATYTGGNVTGFGKIWWRRAR